MADQSLGMERAEEIAGGAVAGLTLFNRLWRWVRPPGDNGGANHADIIAAIDGLRVDMREQFRQVHERLITLERR